MGVGALRYAGVAAGYAAGYVFDGLYFRKNKKEED